jgi:hypothetical protein
MDVPEWLRWMSGLVGLWKTLISHDGTIAINLMDTFVQGTPCISPYVERFTLDAIDTHGLMLAGRMPWHSPTKLGSIEWSAKRKVRPKNTMEHILLFSKTPHPSWDIRRMPQQSRVGRTPSAITNDSRRTREQRPSGYDINSKAFQGETSLPQNLIIAGGASGADHYSRRIRAAGLPAHPARFPTEIPRRIIMMTSNVGDTVYDPMAGSGVTSRVASDLGRRFLSSEAMLAYVQGSALRFDHETSYRAYPIPT